MISQTKQHVNLHLSSFLSNHFCQYKNILLPMILIFLRSIRDDQEEMHEEKHRGEEGQCGLLKVKGQIPYQVQVHLGL